jgi:hypothetical protein
VKKGSGSSPVALPPSDEDYSISLYLKTTVLAPFLRTILPSLSTQYPLLLTLRPFKSTNCFDSPFLRTIIDPVSLSILKSPVISFNVKFGICCTRFFGSVIDGF